MLGSNKILNLKLRISNKASITYYNVPQNTVTIKVKMKDFNIQLEIRFQILDSSFIENINGI